jgi:hypothetical protein
MVGTCRISKQAGGLDRILYACASIVTAWTPIFVAGIGALIPTVSAAALAEIVYYKKGRFVFTVQTGESVAALVPVYYDTLTDKVTSTQSATTQKLIGFSVAASYNGTGGNVEVELFDFPLAGAVSKENLDSGILPSNITVFEGTFAAGGTQATETKLLTGCLSTDEVWMQIKTLGGDTSAYIKNVPAPADGSISCVLNTPMGSGSPVLRYRVDRQVS